MKKVLITLKGSDFFGEVGEIVEETPTLYSVHIGESQYMIYDYQKSECEVLLPLSKIVKAWEDGKEIEFWGNGDWYSSSCLVFSCNDYYRIKPEPKEQIVPYTWEDRDLLRGLWVKYKHERFCEIMVTGISEEFVYTDMGKFTYQSFHKDCTHLDGTPLGKKI